MEDRGEVQFAGPHDAERVGIGVVHQELPLLPNLTAAENMVLGQQSGGFLRPAAVFLFNLALLAPAAMFPGAPPANVRLGEVGMHGWPMTAIIRARYLGSRVVILDEPTSSLDAGGTTGAARQPAADGPRRRRHPLCESFSRGRPRCLRRRDRAARRQSSPRPELLACRSGSSCRHDGRRDNDHGRHSRALEIPQIRTATLVSSFTARSGIGPLDLTVSLGERVGLYGLEGSGCREALKAIFGLRAHAGEIAWRGRRLSGNASARIPAGVGSISGDRARTLIGEWSVARNHSLTALANRGQISALGAAEEIRSARTAIQRLAVKGEATQPIRSLSGGNQQKVAIGRWLERNGICLLAADPTPGGGCERPAGNSQHAGRFLRGGQCAAGSFVRPRRTGRTLRSRADHDGRPDRRRTQRLGTDRSRT